MLQLAEERELQFVAVLVGEGIYFGIVLFVFFDFVLLVFLEESVFLCHVGFPFLILGTSLFYPKPASLSRGKCVIAAGSSGKV